MQCKCRLAMHACSRWQEEVLSTMTPMLLLAGNRKFSLKTVLMLADQLVRSSHTPACQFFTCRAVSSAIVDAKSKQRNDLLSDCSAASRIHACAAV